MIGRTSYLGQNLELEITVVAPAYMWIMVLGNMQLALRQPGNTGASAEMSREFGDRLLEKLIAEGVFTAEEAIATRSGALIWRDEVDCPEPQAGRRLLNGTTQHISVSKPRLLERGVRRA